MKPSPDLNDTWRDVARILYRHKAKGIALFVLAMTITGAYVVFGPRTYESEAVLLVRIGRESVTLDPTATTGQTVDLYRTNESEVKSTVEILKSNRLAERAVDAVGIDRILGSTANNKEGGGALSLLKSLKTLVRKLDPLTAKEAAIITFQEHFDVATPRLSDRRFYRCGSSSGWIFTTSKSRS